MRQLLPSPVDDIDPVAVQAGLDRPPPDGRPWVAVNMVMSADGTFAADGTSDAFGDDGDKKMFSAMRRAADVILAGASTVRAEGYGPARGDDPAPIYVVSRSLDLDFSSPLFTEAKVPTGVITVSSAPPDRLAAARAAGDVIVAGETSVDFGAALAEMGLRGSRFVLSEGGPKINEQMLASGVIDELALTLSPRIASGRRGLFGDPADLVGLRLTHAWAEGDEVLFRYLIGTER